METGKQYQHPPDSNNIGIDPYHQSGLSTIHMYSPYTYPPRPQSITLIDTHSPHLLDSKSNDNFDKTKNKPLLINTTHLSMMHNIIPSVTTHEHWTHENRNHQTRYTRNKQTHATTQSTGKEESRTDRNQTQLCHYTVITTCTQLQSG